MGRGADERLHFTPTTGGTRWRAPCSTASSFRAVATGQCSAVTRHQLEARYLLRADDGGVFDILNRGYYRASSEIAARLEAGENVDESLYCFRCAPCSRLILQRTGGSPITSLSALRGTRTARSASGSTYSTERAGGAGKQPTPPTNPLPPP
ncbi:DUF3237 family protein, partial [Arthrobacter sp. S2(2024)]|uniref:DUF3237 family protein n=1 Tax=Arthrobacter sp. S2(2024) TaxID=3111911 RepID=UPI003FA5C38C